MNEIICRTQSELETLIYAFNNPKYDNPPQKPDYDKIKKELRELGYPEISLNSLVNLVDTYKDDLAAYNCFLKYGM